MIAVYPKQQVSWPPSAIKVLLKGTMWNKVCKIDPSNDCEEHDLKSHPSSDGVQNLWKNPSKRHEIDFLNFPYYSRLIYSLIQGWWLVATREVTEVNSPLPPPPFFPQWIFLSFIKYLRFWINSLNWFFFFE